MKELKENVKKAFAPRWTEAQSVLAEAGKKAGVDFMLCNKHECALMETVIYYCLHNERKKCIALMNAIEEMPFFRAWFLEDQAGLGQR